MQPSHPDPGRVPTGAPFVSVIVPVYNDAVGIEASLAALLGQTYARDGYEVVVVDNGSEDGTREVVERFESGHPGRIRRVEEADVRGSYAARNRGLEAARGSIIAFTDADCIPAPDWLAEGVAVLGRTGAAFAAGRVEITFREDEPNVWEYYDAVGKLNQRRYVERYGFGATANLFVRRDRFERHGEFRSDLVSGGDYEFGRRLTNAGERGVYAERALVRHPARSSAREVLRKERRIVAGKRRLESLGLLEHGRLTWRSFVPIRRCLPLDGRRPGVGHCLAFVVVANLVRYYVLTLRLFGAGDAAGRSGGRGG